MTKPQVSKAELDPAPKKNGRGKRGDGVWRADVLVRVVMRDGIS